MLRTTICCLVALAVVYPRAAHAGQAMTPDEFRIYCGFLAAKNDEKLSRLPKRRRERKIARMAGVKVRRLRDIVKRGATWGDDCDSIVAAAQKAIAAKLEETRLKGRVEFVEVNAPEWDQIVVRIRWKGREERDVEEEAATAAWATYAAFPMVHTMACAAADPLAPNSTLFEGIIARERMANIRKDQIDTFADTRYIRLFDNRKFAKPRAMR